MTIQILLMHFSLAIVMFFTINWLGKHSLSYGYVTLSAFVQSDDAPAFNFLYRVLSPVVLTVIFASIFYTTDNDYYVNNIWLATVFYCLGRLLFIFIFGRIYLINWFREFLIWLLSIAFSWLVYYTFIQHQANLLPQPEDLKNEFWILIILFVYTSLNQVDFGDDATKKRKKRYFNKAYLENKRKYHSLITLSTVDVFSETLVYSILLFENFNRPTFIRFIEKLVFPRFARSIGPMQITTNLKLSDYESVKLGSKKIVDSYIDAIRLAKEKALEKDIMFNPYTDSDHRAFLQYKVASDYNKDDAYVEGVMEVHEKVIEYFYPNLEIITKPYSRLDYYIR